MAGIHLENGESWETGGHFGTRDLQLACILSTLGFPSRGTMPVMLQYDGNKIHKALTSHITNDHGNLVELASVYCVFAYSITHPRLDEEITCPQVERAFKLAKLLQERERGDVSLQLQNRIANATKWCDAGNVSQGLRFIVQCCLDTMCNWNVYAEVIADLSGNPFIKFTRALSKGVHHAVNPLDTESTTINRAERFFKH